MATKKKVLLEQETPVPENTAPADGTISSAGPPADAAAPPDSDDLSALLASMGQTNDSALRINLMATPLWKALTLPLSLWKRRRLMKLPPRVTARPLAPLPIRMSLPDRRPVRKRLLPICLLKVQMTPRRRRFPKLLGSRLPPSPSGHPGGKRRRLWKLPYMARMRTLRRLRLLKSRLWNLPPLLRIRRRLMREKHPFQRIPLPKRRRR